MAEKKEKKRKKKKKNERVQSHIASPTGIAKERDYNRGGEEGIE